MKNKKQKRGKKKENFLRKNYFLSFKYIKECRNFIYFIIGIFLLFVLIGYFAPLPEEVSEKIVEMLKELFEKTKDYGLLEMIGFIFLNNLKSSFFGVVFGVVFGIFPVLSSVFNGFLLGFVANLTVKEQGILVLWQLFPHGVFELPAVFISLAMGIKLGTFFFEKNKLKKFTYFLLNSFRVFFFIVIPLLIIAAVIESILIVGLR